MARLLEIKSKLPFQAVCLGKLLKLSDPIFLVIKFG